MYKGRLKRSCSSRDGVYLGPEKDKAVYQSGPIDTSFGPPLFSLDSTFKSRKPYIFPVFPYFPKAAMQC